MKPNKEWIDTIAPTHERTSCSDVNTGDNGFCRITEETLKGVVVARRFDPAPRCVRCFLLEYLKVDQDIDPRIQLRLTLNLKEPKFVVTGEKATNV